MGPESQQEPRVHLLLRQDAGRPWEHRSLHALRLHSDQVHRQDSQHHSGAAGGGPEEGIQTGAREGDQTGKVSVEVRRSSTPDDGRSPAHSLCDFMYEVANTFTEFYEKCYCVEKDK